ncbi:aspartate aminotransferase family protein [Desulfovibrio sp. 86]|uniref:Taurine--pyruvate aminotransferase n=1 Tax=uncultured Desulfovibrio sp. TaxID=167968 RepID=A0A212L2U0_9BACT|nr:aspartate aminotransferase family protein [Desulfovibrio sp. 86]SCM71872.1 Acetylornithine aminotransferase [uncultured Desulfovibrio sp.]VZH33154.1 Acetylornithine aminotransferase [Desulfovibrio sp. 86]
MSQAFAAVKAGEESLLCRSYSRYPVAVVRGKGARLWDVDGKEYVDLLAGIAVTALGHCNDEVNAALTAQAEKLWHVSNLFYQNEQLELARLLLSTSHHNKAFFCNSGAEANEACIKLARRYMRKVKLRDAYEIITLDGCFHGRTLGALAATGRESLSDGFTPLPEGFKQVPACDLEAMKAAITPATAAVMVEVVQGEGGVVPLCGDYLRQLEALCRERDVLFMCDEVQDGLCRTGKFWAFQNYGLTPDAISVAKSLANGLPMGAMLATDAVACGFEAGSHATTFGGGALVSGVATKVVEILLRDKLAENAANLGAHVKREMAAMQDRLPGKIKEVRGMGLMIGIELAVDGKAVWEELLRRGYICNLSHGVTLRLLPALNIDKADLDSFMHTLEEILGGRTA